MLKNVHNSPTFQKKYFIADCPRTKLKYKENGVHRCSLNIEESDINAMSIQKHTSDKISGID